MIFRHAGILLPLWFAMASWFVVGGMAVGQQESVSANGLLSSALPLPPLRLTTEPSGPIDPMIDTLVICPRAFQDEMQRWVKYRESQDFKIAVQPPGRSAFDIRQQIRFVAQSRRLKHVLIVGDAGDSATEAALRVPTDYVMARVNVQFGSEPEIATDNTYADLDDDGIPDLSLGRIPVDSVAELRNFIDRVIGYESRSSACACQQRINFVAGMGGFGKVIDGVIEETTKQIIQDLVPATIKTSMTYGSWTSPYCPDPRRFSDAAIERFNEGCLFWVYIGHGARDRLDKVHMPDQSHRILDRKLVDEIDCREGSPIAVFLACYTGAIDGRDDGLAELMLKRPHGPIATIGGTRVTMPAAMALLSLEMMHEYFHGQAQTLGEVFLLSKQRMINGSLHYREYREMIEGMAGTFNPVTSFGKEKYEHAHLLNLLGDPLLKVARPEEIVFGAPTEAVPGETIQLQGKSPAEGKLKLELAYQRDRLRQRFSRRRDYDSSEESFLEYQQTYDQSRDLVCVTRTIDVHRGWFSTELEIPEAANGPCVIRALLPTAEGLALGAIEIEIKKSPAAPAASAAAKEQSPRR